MKKLITSVLVALLPLIASAYEFKYQGIYYNVTEWDEVEVTYPDYGDEPYSGAIVIPERVVNAGHYFTVTSIGEFAFEDCVNVTSVVIPSTVTRIDNLAFYDCIGLSSIVIPSSVTEIGDEPFSGCYFIPENFVNNSSISDDDFGAGILGEGAVEQNDGLVISDNEVVLCRPWATSVTIPNSVTSIGSYAFEGCSSLTSVTIPKSVTSIGNYAFENCSSLASMKVENGNPVYDSRNNCNAIIETATNTLAFGCMNTVVPSSVTGIGVGAFLGATGLTSLTIPNSVTSIGINAFFKCSSLTSVNIPDGVTELASSIFSGCSSLASITIPNGVTSIGSYAFSSCPLTSIVIPESVTSISYRVFDSCKNLTSVTIPSSLNFIDVGVFLRCDNLSYNEYDNGLYLGNRDNPYLVLVKAKSKDIKTCTVHEGCKLVTEAFYGCTSLNSVSIPEGVTFIGKNAFYGCSNLSSLTIPSSITRIYGEDVFLGCSNLQYAEYDNGLYLGNSENAYLVLAKTTSTDITDFYVDGWCKIISPKAFYQCTSLTSVTIPEGVVSIEEKAFEFCSNLNSVTLPSTVAYVGTYAFANCTGFSDFTCLAEEVPETERNAFGWCETENKTLHVPGASIESYQNTYPWSNFGSIVAYYPPTFEKEVDGLWYRFETERGCATVIPSRGYEGYSGDIVIPATIEDGGMTFIVTEIDGYAFSAIGTSAGYSSGITSITIPETVWYIGDGAFADCSIPNILIKNATPPYIGYSVFSDPTYYHATLYIPNGSWYEYAFNSDWYRFINIRETTLEEEQLSMQQAYTLMDAGTFAYTVYDAVNNRISTVSVINEENPNHCWQVIEEAGERYLYNLGAKKFAVASANGTLALTDEPTAIEMGDGEDGIVFDRQEGRQWAFVSNDRMSVEDTIIDGIKSLTPTLSEGDGEWFDLSGRKLDTPQKGINIIRHADGTSRKVLVK